MWPCEKRGTVRAHASSRFCPLVFLWFSLRYNKFCLSKFNPGALKQHFSSQVERGMWVGHQEGPALTQAWQVSPSQVLVHTF